MIGLGSEKNGGICRDNIFFPSDFHVWPHQMVARVVESVGQLNGMHWQPPLFQIILQIPPDSRFQTRKSHIMSLSSCPRLSFRNSRSSSKFNPFPAEAR